VCNLREYRIGTMARVKAHGEAVPVALVRLVVPIAGATAAFWHTSA